MQQQGKKVYIFDTTLRDGQQSPGAGMSFEDNIKYADLANDLNIDVLEAGFPSASNLDFEIVNTISKRMADKGSNMVIAGLCQLRESQVRITMDALRPSLASSNARVHTYLPVDPSLAQASLGSKNDAQQNIKNVYKLIKIATDEGFEVEFSAEGYSRLGDTFDYVTDVISAAVSAGATIINCPDTIGGACDKENENYFVNNMIKHAKIIKEMFPDKNIIWSAHCHNDLGLALTNSMNAVFDGVATQIEGCINGVGERAGNVSLEQCIMYINLFGKDKFYNEINTKNLKSISDFIAAKMLDRQPHSPITGYNSAKHTSGGHINAILKNPLAYQPFDPQDVGNKISFVFGPLSGGNHSQKVIEDMGYICTSDEKAKIAQQIKDFYAERRKGVTDDELLVAYKYIRAPIKMQSIDYGRSNGNTYVSLNGQFFDKQNLEANADDSNSPLTVLMNSIHEYLPSFALIDYRSKALSHEISSLSESAITIKSDNSEVFVGKAQDKDIEISVLKALIDAVNKLFVEVNFKK